MGAQYRCGHCKRGLSYQLWCPLSDIDTATCVLGEPSPKKATQEQQTLRAMTAKQKDAQ